MTAHGRRWLTACLAIAVCLGLAQSFPALPAATEGQEAPRLQVRNSTVDLGTITVGEQVEARWALENAGNGLLKILSAEASCSCALAAFDEAILPGQVGFVRAVLDTTDLWGPVTKGIVVRTNAPGVAQVVLTLKAQIVGGVALLPQPHIFMRRRSGETYAGRVLIRREPGLTEPLVVSHVETSAAWLTASARRVGQAQPRGGGLPEGLPGDWVLEVRFAKDEPVYGRLRETVRFRTGLSRQPEVVVDVESNLEAPVSLSTGRLVLIGGEGTGARGTLFLLVRAGLDPQDLRVEPEPRGLEVDLHAPTGRILKVEVRWSGGALTDAFVRFRIGNEAVRLPVEWDGS